VRRRFAITTTLNQLSKAAEIKVEKVIDPNVSPISLASFHWAIRLVIEPGEYYEAQVSRLSSGIGHGT